MTKNIVYCFIAVLAILTISKANIAMAYDTVMPPCYVYNSSLYTSGTQNITLFLKDGTTKSATIANQSTPTILSKIGFTANKTYSNGQTTTCATEAWWSYYPNYWLANTWINKEITLSNNTSVTFDGFPVWIKDIVNEIPTNSYSTDGYGSYWFDIDPFVYNGIGDLKNIADEDAVIKDIDTNKKINFKLGSSVSYDVSNYTVDQSVWPNKEYDLMSAPATNCALLSGNASSDSIKVVFMRNDDTDGVSDFLDQALKMRDGMVSRVENPAIYTFYADLKKWPKSSSISSSCGTANQYIYIPNETYVITVAGGITKTVNDPIFSWVDANITKPNGFDPTIRIPSWGHSVAHNTNLLRKYIELGLASGKKVLVLGHSMGSLIAYNVITKEYQGQPVVGVYIDPPYAEDIYNVVFSRMIPGVSTLFNNALAGGIATDPGSEIWTQGRGLVKMWTHDPFGHATWDSTIIANLQHLANFVNGPRLIALNNSTISPTIPSAQTAMVDAPIIKNYSADYVDGGTLAPGKNLKIYADNLSQYGNNIYIENKIDPSISYSFYGLLPTDNYLNITLPDMPDITTETEPGDYYVYISGRDSEFSTPITITIDSETTIPAPTISTISGTTVQGGTVTVTGSGFNIGKNNVRLVVANPSGTVNSFSHQVANALSAFWEMTKSFFTTSKAHSQTASVVPYYVTTADSIDGRSITFSIPNDIAPGKYTVQVSQPNGTWSDGSVISIEKSSSGNTGSGSGTVIDASTPTMIYRCDSTYGYSFRDENPNKANNYSLFKDKYLCYKANGQSENPLEVGLICTDNGYTLYRNNKTCLSTKTGIDIPVTGAKATYTCSLNWSKTAVPNFCVNYLGKWDYANETLSCPIGYNLQNNKCYINNIKGLTAKSTELGKVSISWDKNIILFAKSFVIERAISSTSPFSSIATINASSTSYIDINLPYDTSYAYRAKVIRTNDQYSSSSNIASVTVKGYSAPVVSKGSTAITATSIPIIIKSTEKVPYFNVYTSSSTTLVAKATSTLTISNLSPTTKYCFVASGYVNDNYSTKLSAPYCATTLSPIAPVSLSIASNSSGKIKLAWSNNNAKSFNYISIERSIGTTTNFSEIGNSTSTYYIDSTVSPKTNYYYRVRISYPFGFSAYSNIKPVTTGSWTVTTNTATTSTVVSKLVTKTATSTDSTQTNTINESKTSVTTENNITVTPTPTPTSTPVPTSTPTPTPTPTTSSTIIKKATISGYTCPIGYTYNTVSKTCKTNSTRTNTESTNHATPTQAPTIVSPIPIYSCPSGYTLNTVTATCSKH